MDQNELKFPHIEIDLRQGTVVISRVEGKETKKRTFISDSGHIRESLAKAESLLPHAIDAEELESDEQANEFSMNHTEVDESIDFTTLLKQLVKKIEKREILGIEECEPDSELYEYLVKNWQIDLFYSYRRAMLYQILKMSLRAAGLNSKKRIETFVLIPGDISDKGLEHFIKDFQTLGLDLQVRFN